MLTKSREPAVASPPRPPRHDDPEALFEEARQHRRERRLRVALIALLVVVAAAGAYGVFGRGTNLSAGEDGSAPVVTAANPTVVLLVDISGSMRSNDIAPTRINAVQAAMRDLVARLPKRSRIALIGFSSSSEVYATPTLDRKAIDGALDQLTPEAGTALGSGLAAAVQLAVGSLAKDGVHARPGHRLPAVIVLASDGAQNSGALSPLQAADLAKTAGIRVDGIALGTASGTVMYGNGVFHESIPVPPDPKVVETIARATGGESFTATTSSRLDSIYRALGSSIGR